MKIYIKTQTGAPIELDDVEAMNTLGEIRKMLEENEGFSIPRQILIDKNLQELKDDNKTLQELGIGKDDQSLQLIIR
jgi:ribosome assembly protein YihI (activator of Der GTPase)